MSVNIFTVLLLSTLCLICFVNGSEKTQSASRLRAEGDAAFHSREYSKALKYYTQLIDVEPTKHSNWYKRALVRLSQSQPNYAKAITDLSKSLGIDDSFATGYFYRAKSYLKIGKCESGLSDLHRLSQLDSSNRHLSELMKQATFCVEHYPRAMQLLEKGECGEAQSVVDQILEISPFDWSLNFGLCDCAESTKDWQSVLKYSANILRSAPQNLDALLRRGRAYYRIGENSMALQHYKSGLKSDPDNKPLKTEFKKLKKLIRLVDGADESFAQRSFEEAIDGYQSALQLDPENEAMIPDLHMKVCRTAVKWIKLAAAKRIEYCTEAVEKNNENAEAYYLRGQSHEMNGDWEAATNAYDAAHNRDNRNREYQQKLQNARFEAKKARRKDYYKILGVSQHASDRDVKKAFRKCGLEHHPDKTQSGSEEEIEMHNNLFRECNEAQEILLDSELRAKYDRGEDVLEQMQGGGRQGGMHSGFPFNFANFGGGGGGGGRQGRQNFNFRFN